MVTGKLGMALGGLVCPQPAAASAYPGLFLPVQQERGLQSGATKILLSLELI